MTTPPTDNADQGDPALFSRVAQLLRRYEAEGANQEYKKELQAARCFSPNCCSPPT